MCLHATHILHVHDILLRHIFVFAAADLAQFGICSDRFCVAAAYFSELPRQVFVLNCLWFAFAAAIYWRGWLCLRHLRRRTFVVFYFSRYFSYSLVLSLRWVFLCYERSTIYYERSADYWPPYESFAVGLSLLWTLCCPLTPAWIHN